MMDLIGFIYAFLSIFYLTYCIIKTLPYPLDTNYDVETDILPKLKQSCCIATIFDKNQLNELYIMGHSLYILGHDLPKRFALSKNKLDDETIANISKYFDYIDISDYTNTENVFHQTYYWKLTKCNPVIALEPNGYFMRPPNEFCLEPTFSSNPKLTDIFNFEPGVMVLDPNDKPNFANQKGKWKHYIQSIYKKWNILKPHLFAMEDGEQYPKIDILFTYERPTFVKYRKESLKQVLENVSIDHYSGSYGVYNSLHSITQGIKDLIITK